MGEGYVHRVGELMRQAESEAGETSDRGKLPQEKLGGDVGGLAGDVGHWSGVGAVGCGDPGSVADRVGTVGVGVGEVDYVGISSCLYSGEKDLHDRVWVEILGRAVLRRVMLKIC